VNIAALNQVILNLARSDLLPPNSTDITIESISPFERQGRSSAMYSFIISFVSEDGRQQREFALKVYNDKDGMKGSKEFEVTRTVGEQNIPVPYAYYFEGPNEMLGEPFMIMDKISGETASYYMNNEESERDTLTTMAETLANIHKVNPEYFKNSTVLRRQFEVTQNRLREIREFVSKCCPNFLGFSPPSPRRFITAVKLLEDVEPEKSYPVLIQGDYEPNHILVSNGRFVTIDWGEACIGDPAYDVAWTYHKLRLGRDCVKTDLGEFFVEKYEQYNPERLTNLQYYKDMVAIEMAVWCGLSPFGANRAKNYRRLVALFIGDPIGQIKMANYTSELKRRMAGHHTGVWSDIEYIQSYVLHFLEKERRQHRK
jgi:aminoglycoside phosphotransferase (APT) family kinase protein